ncbi:MAG: phosphoglycerate mutase family protein [Microthrixaceae bacterium]
MTSYLVRHGSAGHRDNFNTDDHDRTLDENGLAQAEKLSDWLRHSPITQILSSPYPRCVQTIEPLARALNLPIQLHEALAESADVDKSWKLLTKAGATTAVFCSHGDVIPDLIRRAQLRGLHIPGKSGCAKGSVWTLDHFDGTKFVTGVYTPITP